MDSFRISYLVLTIIITPILLNDSVMGQQDPCYFHQEINDTTMTLGFVLAPSDSVVCDTISPGWTRFSGSDEGLMATECPLGRECGTDQQVWMQGKPSGRKSRCTSPDARKVDTSSIPSYYDGLTEVDICIRGNGDCCDRQNRMQVKNCNSFLVYNILSVPACSRYCFNESSEMLITVSTSSSTSTTSSTPTIPSSTSIKTTSQPTSVLSTSIKTTISTATRVPTIYRTSTLKSSGKGCISGSAVAGMFSVTSALTVIIFK